MRKRMNYVPISRIVWVVNVWKAECLYRYIRSGNLSQEMAI